jgi:glycosyltransferase involved in cell wall biosynthesis
MKILIFSWRDIKNPRAGGSEFYFHELAKGWVKKGNNVTMICGGWKGCTKKDRIDGINIIRSGNSATLYLIAPFVYFNLKEKPDIVIDVENGIPFFTPIFSKTKNVLHIHHVHKDVWFKEFKFPISFIGYLIETKILPFFYKKSKVITISDSSKKEIEHERLGRVIGIVNPGIDFPDFKRFSKEKKPTLLFLNRIKKYKGLKVLLDSAIILRDKKIKIWVAGTGDYLDEMKKYAHENGLANVIFLGRVDENKKRELMQKAWAFINPSFKEGWGIVNIESNYFGTPVIGSNVSGIKDSVIDGKTGLLFEYGNSQDLSEKIMKLINNEKLRIRMQKNAVKWARKFDWGSKSSEYLNILRTI